MEQGRENDRECRATNEECNKNSENESKNKQQLCNSEVGSSFPEEESEEDEVQSKETRLPEYEFRTYISGEEQSDDDEGEEEEEDDEEEESGEEFQARETKITKEEENMKNFNDKNERVVRAGPNPPPPLPPDFKNCIQQKFQGLEISISDEVLVIQKQLSENEVNQDQPPCRLHIPSGLLRKKHFNDDVTNSEFQEQLNYQF